MKLHLNGALVDLNGQTLTDLLVEHGFANAKVATAVNEVFVPAPARGETNMVEGDRVEVLAPMQGG